MLVSRERCTPFVGVPHPGLFSAPYSSVSYSSTVFFCAWELYAEKLRINAKIPEISDVLH